MKNEMKDIGERQVGTKLSDIEKKHVERYKFAQKYCKDKEVLDAACGCGYGSYILSQEAKSVLGVDYSQEAIDYAKKIWWDKNITFKRFDLNFDLKSLGTFDVIVSLETVEHLDIEITKICQNFYKILRPGGLLILSHPEKEKSQEEEDLEKFSVIITWIRAMQQNIQKAIDHLQKKDFLIFWRYIKNKILNKKKKIIAKTFHKHFNIDGEYVKNMMVNVGFQIKNEWHQSGRFYYLYHLIVVEKK